MLAPAALAARLVLAAVFGVAGFAKLRDRAGTKAAVVEFGAPQPAALPLALFLPLAELTVAGLLLPGTTARTGAVGAAALLLVFSAAIAFSLARGRAPECHCFGQLHSAPTGWKTLARNGVLVALATFALAGSLTRPDRSAIAWIGRLNGAEVVALAVGASSAVLLAAVTIGFMTLLRSYGGVLVRLDRIEQRLAEAGLELTGTVAPPEVGLEPGTRAPTFTAADVTGRFVTLDDLLAPGLPLLLVFTSPHCGPCASLRPIVASWQREHADRLLMAIASTGTIDAVRTEAEEDALEHVLVDQDGDLYSAYGANGTPSAVLIEPDGTIASWVASGQESIETLVAETLAGGNGETAGLAVGSEVPALELRSLEGELVTSADLRGQDTLFVFWNPSCGFCRAMHEDLLAWEQRTARNGATQLVVVSSGDVEDSRAEGFRSRVLLDESFAAAEAFGAHGTPMAVLLDAEGRVASNPVVGAEAVLALANGRS